MARSETLDYSPDAAKNPTFEAVGPRASSDAFGGQVGAGVAKVGEAVTNVADIQQQQLAETAFNHAEAAHAQAIGDIKAKYMQLEGTQAALARPQMEAEIQNATQSIRGTLNPAAAREFDKSSLKMNAYTLSDYASYTAGQVKSALKASLNAVGDSIVAKANDINNVMDPHTVGNDMGDITNVSIRAAKVDGIFPQTQDETKAPTFDDTPESQNAKARYEQIKNTLEAKYWSKGIESVNNWYGGGVAKQWFDDHKDRMNNMALGETGKFVGMAQKNQFTTQLINSSYQNEIANINNPLANKDALSTIRENEGTGYSKDNKGEVVNGINSLAFPKEFSEAKQILDTQGQEAANKYSDAFYQKNIIQKYGIDKLPPATQAIVADGIVNHGGGAFGQSLIDAAKNGASSQQLIDMRRQEYQRLNDTGKPEYTSSFEGWNNRLDKLQAQSQSSENPPETLQEHFYKPGVLDAYKANVYDDYLSHYGDDFQGAEKVSRAAVAKVNQEIAIEKKSYSTIASQIQAAGEQHNIGNIEDLKYADPKFKPVIEDMQANKPKQYDQINNVLQKRFSKPSGAVGLGDDFVPMMQRMVSNDPQNLIDDHGSLVKAYYNAGDKVTHDGFTKLDQLVKLNDSPEGKERVQNIVSYSNALADKMGAGHGNPQYDKNYQMALKQFISKAAGSGTDATNPAFYSLDPDKSGSFLNTLKDKLPKPTEVTASKLTNALNYLKTYTTWFDKNNTMPSDDDFEKMAQTNKKINSIPKPE